MELRMSLPPRYFQRNLVFRAWLVVFTTAAACSGARAEEKLGYNQYIRPILSENCFYCHGPDKNHRKAKLRLDIRDSALTGGKSGDPAIVPNKPDASELVKRILSTDEDEQMPPPDSHKSITPAQREILRKWIEQGAEYEPHWAYITPKRSAPPQVKDAAWVKNPVDAFILKPLESKNISPSKEADRRTLLRRLSLDLIGLPPTPPEIDAFLNDHSPDAYEKQVDRLLASPHYGERMAVPWLDAVRFADTVGFHGDQNQNVFPYRDYVINAFNANKPFDQFTIEQIAGDLLPNPTLEQRTATCFNRLTMMTREGGAQAKEYLSKYGADRVRTVSNAWLGSTMGCCECHDHKFDPFTAKDFYSMEAFWADVKQWGVYTTYGYTPNPDLKGWTNDHPFPPEVTADSPYLHQREHRLTAEIDALAFTALADPKHKAEFDAWSARTLHFLKHNPTGWTTPARLSAAPTTAPSSKSVAAADGSVLFTGKVGATDKLDFSLKAGTIAAIRLEALPHATNAGSIVRKGATVAKEGAPEKSATVQPVFSLKSKGKPDAKLAVFYAEADHKDERYRSGYTVLGVADMWKTSTTAAKSPQSAVYLLDAPITAADGDTLTLTLPKNTLGCVRVSVSPIAALKPTDTAFADQLREALNHPAHGATIAHRAFLTSTAFDHPRLALARTLQREIYDCRDGKSPVLTTEAIAPAVVRILPRGNWQDDSGAIVTPAAPHFLPQPNAPEDHRLTRMDLAQWLISADNPLTSRAIVNRFWKQLFGNGLANSVEDLGAQGEWPSHPELLDWLAVEFRESGWNVKHIVRLMVTSAAYRQNSSLRPELKDLDPANRWLASQNPRRLEAEFVRDTALAAAGALTLDIGGPSVFPYQPEGYYVNIQFPDRKYIASIDDRQYRRGVYSHWQRTFVHPMLANFDAPSREDSVCTRNVSNTPQQALTLLNDPSFVEAARLLAAKVMTETSADAPRIEAIYQRTLSRSPKQKERDSLARFLTEQRAYYSTHKDDANKLTSVGIAPPSANVDESDLAVWTTVCRVVLNLHETITRY